MIFLIILLVALIAIIVYLYLRPNKKRATTPAAYLEGLIALLDQNEELALRRLKEAVTADTDLTDAYIRLGDLYRKKGDIDRAIQIHQSLTVRPTLKKDDEKKVYFALIQDYIAAGRPNKSVAFLKEIIKIDRNDRTAWDLVIRLYEDLQNWSECVAAYEEQPRSEFRDSRRHAFALAALAGARMKEPPAEENAAAEKEIQSLLKKALRINPDSLAALYYSAEYFRLHDDLKKAREYYLKIAGLAPDFMFLIIPGLEKVMYDLGSFEEMIPLYEKIFQANPKNFPTAYALAALYEKKNDLELAREVYRKVAEIYPRSVVPRLNLLRLSTDDKNARRDLIDLIKTQGDLKYLCAACGTMAEKFSFLCPVCHALESYKPR